MLNTYWTLCFKPEKPPRYSHSGFKFNKSNFRRKVFIPDAVKGLYYSIWTPVKHESPNYYIVYLSTVYKFKVW
jgi:hypothetical protein